MWASESRLVAVWWMSVVRWMVGVYEPVQTNKEKSVHMKRTNGLGYIFKVTRRTSITFEFCVVLFLRSIRTPNRSRRAFGGGSGRAIQQSLLLLHQDLVLKGCRVWTRKRRRKGDWGEHSGVVEVEVWIAQGKGFGLQAVTGDLAGGSEFFRVFFFFFGDFSNGFIFPSHAFKLYSFNANLSQQKWLSN